MRVSLTVTIDLYWVIICGCSLEKTSHFTVYLYMPVEDTVQEYKVLLDAISRFVLIIIEINIV